MIKTGTYLDLLLMIVMIAATYYYYEKTKDPNWKPFIRHIPALDGFQLGSFVFS